MVAQQVQADLIMAQHRHPLAAPHIAAHNQAMGVLAKGVLPQQLPDILQSGGVIVGLIVMIGYLGQYSQVACSKALALHDDLRVH